MNGVTIHDHSPAINVKVYNGFPSTTDVIARFPGTSEHDAQRALEFAWDSACQEFWEYWTDPARVTEYFRPAPALRDLRIESGGRSNGWLEVTNMPEQFSDPATWPKYLRTKWAKFEKEVKADVEYRCSVEYVMEAIEVNEWVRPMSTQYNFLTSDGKSISLPTLRGDVVAFVKQKYGVHAAQYITRVLAGGN